MRFIDTTPIVAAFALSMPACSQDRVVNADQEVTLSEYKEGQLAQYKRLDYDGDGVVEYGRLPKKVGKRLGRMDADRDGRVTMPEFEEGLKEAFAKADVNHDGTLQSSEQH